MWPREGTVLTVSSRALVQACEGLGLDTGAMLAAAGITRETLADPDARLRNQDVGALWAKAYELSRDPVLSLHVAEACPVGAYKVIDYMGANARTVGESFRCAARYFPLINTAVRLVVDEGRDPVTFDVVEARTGGRVSRAYAEFCLAVFVLHVRGGTGVPFPVRRVTFTAAAPDDVREHERIFGAPVSFGADHDRLELDRAVWETPSISPHTGVLAVLIEHADHLLTKLPSGPDLVERTRRAIAQRLRGGEPTLEGVARELGLSARSLQRHLRELGSSFNALADEVREATAWLYLRQPDLALAEVAFLLGFADQSAFHRAFKRWTGLTPRQARLREVRTGAARADA